MVADKTEKTAARKKAVGPKKRSAPVKRASKKKASKAASKKKASGASGPTEEERLDAGPGSDSVSAEAEERKGCSAKAKPGKKQSGPAKPISRKELLEGALERVRKELDSDGALKTGVIGNLVQLLKLERELVDEDNVPHEIRVLWEEINGESSEGE